MNSSKIMNFATAGLGLALILGGCGSSSNNTPPEGSGGNTQGSGGTTSSSGGSTGSGGHTSSGGTTGSGGETGSGGKVGSGGTSSSGGTTGSGGTSSSGGTTGSGGATTSSGGASAGGATGSGGSAGGSIGSGGKAGGSGSGSGGKAGGSGSGSGGTAGGSGSGSFTLTSPDQPDGAHFTMMFTCAAGSGTVGSGGVNPELNWSGAPSGTKSYAMTFLDVSLTNGTNQQMKALGDHWAAWNIPAAAMQMPKGTTMLTGALMGAMQTNKWLAPCPSGNDMYEITIYALSTETLTVSGNNVSGSGTSNTSGVMAVVTALDTATKAGQVLGTATIHGTSSPMGK